MYALYLKNGVFFNKIFHFSCQLFMTPQKKLQNWYGLNQRDLPWRNTQNPYVIWLSEVILQQTRVQQGLPYFQKFLAKYPTVFLLASAKEDDILKLWQGLGYYSRARNMHHTAKIVLNEYKGVFPSTYNGLIQLKGIGPYTAAAIASFAFNEQVAVLEGNVFRVLSRLFCQKEPINSTFGKKIFTELAQSFLNLKEPAIHNQAMMELGSLICTPSNPNCKDCPLQNNCLANSLGQQLAFPIKEKKLKVKNRYLAYFHFEVDGYLAIYQRPAGDIWQNLFDLPFLEMDEPKETQFWISTLIAKSWISKSDKIILGFQRKHLLTHRRIFAAFYKVSLKKRPVLNLNEVWVKKNEISKYGISRLLDHYLIQNFSKLKTEKDLI
jgi:A/G-specific adenine glycosylase